MVRIQSPRAVRGWRSQSLDTRYYSRRWRRGGGSWCRHNFLRNNCRWFAGQSRAGVSRPVFKRRFPAKINQHTDNKYFGKRSHGKMTFPKSGTQRNCCLLSIRFRSFQKLAKIARMLACVDQRAGFVKDANHGGCDQLKNLASGLRSLVAFSLPSVALAATSVSMTPSSSNHYEGRGVAQFEGIFPGPQKKCDTRIRTR